MKTSLTFKSRLASRKCEIPKPPPNVNFLFILASPLLVIIILCYSPRMHPTDIELRHVYSHCLQSLNSYRQRTKREFHKRHGTRRFTFFFHKSVVIGANFLTILLAHAQALFSASSRDHTFVIRASSSPIRWPFSSMYAT